MKKLFFVLALSSATSAFGTTFQFKIDDVDTVSFKRKIILVEDLRDGFETIKGIDASEDVLNVDSNSEAKIQLKSGLNINFSAKASTRGGDMGGG